MSIISPICGYSKRRKSKGIRGTKMSLPRYKDNLKVDDEFVYSYGTKVAQINHANKTIKPLGFWSTTTSKHINYVGSNYGYKVLKK